LKLLSLACSAIALALSFFASNIAHAQIMILSDPDAQAYARAFDAALRGDGDGVENALGAVHDLSLAGHVEARLLLASGAKPKRAAFIAWLERNPNHPLTRAVARRANELSYRSLPQTRTPAGRLVPGAGRTPSGDNASARVGIERIVLAFGAGDFLTAQAEGQRQLSGPRSGQAAWWLGLVAWRAQDFAAAQHYFAQAAIWPSGDSWFKSGAEFWAARAALALGDTPRALAALNRAALWPATFYGQLAEAQLGRDTPLDFSVPALDAETAQTLSTRHPGAHRAIALAQLGRLSDVETELSLLHRQLSAADDRAFLALAVALAAPAAQLRVAEHGKGDVAAGFCPASTFTPADGFRIDRAVIYAIIRQESRFSPVAVSHSNARGLMQLLPSTAHDMDSDYAFRRQPTRLNDPALNMRLGQQYVEWLDANFDKGGDLARIFAAYNGGPGWLSRWEASYPRTDDPLLWMESLPRTESRDYAERVLSHFALCRKRFGQPVPEFAALANGMPAVYRPLDR
jgi:soluble lytic murein transglycosylase-like protein